MVLCVCVCVCVCVIVCVCACVYVPLWCPDWWCNLTPRDLCFQAPAAAHGGATGVVPRDRKSGGRGEDEDPAGPETTQHHRRGREWEKEGEGRVGEMCAMVGQKREGVGGSGWWEAEAEKGGFEEEGGLL